jgi:hypothetical protein
MLTKQLQVLIDVSLSSGRSFDDIRNLLKAQGFSDSVIDDTFEAYRARGPVKQGMVSTSPATSAPSTPPATAVPPAKVYEAPVIMPHHSAPPVAPTPPQATPVASSNVPPDFVPAPVILPRDASSAPGVPTMSQAVRVDVSPDFAPGANIPAQPPAASMDPEPLQQGVAHSTQPVVPSQTSASVLPVTSSEPTRLGYEPIQLPSQMMQQQRYGLRTAPESTPARSSDTRAAPPLLSTMPAPGAINVGISTVPELERAALEDYQRKLDKSPVPLIIMLIVVVALIGGFAYWFFSIGPGVAMRSPQISVDEIRTATPTIEEIIPLSNTPEDIDPFTGAPRVPNNATITPIVVPPPADGDLEPACGPFKQDLQLDATGPEVVMVQNYFGNIGLFEIFEEKNRVDGTIEAFAITPGVYDKNLQAAVRFYQQVMFDGVRSVSNLAFGTLDQPTREVMFADCGGETFNRYYKDVLHTERDTKTKAVLGSIRIAVFGYFDTVATFEGLCTNSADVTKALTELGTLTGELGGPICRSTNSDWIIAAPLYGTPGLWCIDSFKNSLEVPSLSSTQLKCK